MVRALLIVFAVIALLLAGRAAFVVPPAAGVFQDPEETGLEGCERVAVAPGTEDVTIDPRTGLVFVSATERRPRESEPDDGIPDNEISDNGIYVFPLDEPEALRRVSVDAPVDFRPHGISRWRGEAADGAPITRLFVISHPDSGHQVLIYDVAEDGRLAHVRTVTDPALRSPNDLVAVGPDQFYATNDLRFAGAWMGVVEAFFALPLGSIAYFDGAKGRIAAGRLAFANGIATDGTGETLYASALFGRKVHVFDRDAETGALTRTRRIPVPLGLDNIEIAPDGDLLIGGTPDIFAFRDHRDDANALAPSQVVRVDPEAGTHETIFYSGGEAISASSVGAVHDGRLVVGAVYDPHVLVCPLQD